MNSEVIIILKNLRYLLIKVEEEYFILDKDKPYLLVFLLPFVYWLFPKRVRKISAESANLLQTVPYEQTNNGKVSFIGVGISLILANLIGPMLDYMDIEISTFVASFIFCLISTALIVFRLIISNRNKQVLFQQLNLKEDGSYKTLWTRPKAFKNILFLIFGTLFCWAFIIASITAFMMYGNVFMLIVYTMFLFLLLFLNLMTVLPGKNTMKFRITK